MANINEPFNPDLNKIVFWLNQSTLFDVMYAHQPSWTTIHEYL